MVPLIEYDPLLPPSIEGILREQQVHVWLHGLLPESQVEVQGSLDGFATVLWSQTFVAVRSSQRFSVTPLVGEQKLRCRTIVGLLASSFGRKKKVAFVPGNLPVPRLQRVEDGAEAVVVEDVRPGSFVTMFENAAGGLAAIVGSETGGARIRAVVEVAPLVKGATLTAESTDGFGGVLTSEPAPVLMSAALLSPRFVGEVFAGQAAVRVWCGHVGARVVVEDGLGNMLVDVVVFQEDGWYWLNDPLVEGAVLVARQEWRRGSLAGSASAPVAATVASADGRPLPRIAGPVYVGQKVLVVHGQLPGGVLAVRRVALDGSTGLVGLRMCALTDEVELGDNSDMLEGGFSLTVATVMDGGEELVSDPIKLELRAAELGAPFIVPQLYVDGRAVLVARVERSVTVAVRYAEGQLVGWAWTGDAHFADVAVWPPMFDNSVAAQQIVPEDWSAERSETPGPRPSYLPVPVIPGPVFFGDTEVVVVGVVPGSAVEVWWAEEDDGVMLRPETAVRLGRRDTSEPIAHIPVVPVPEGAWAKIAVETSAPGRVQARARLGTLLVTSAWVRVLRDPSLPGLRPGGTPRTFVVDENVQIGEQLGALWAPARDDGAGVVLDLPLDAYGNPVKCPIVFIQHGDPPSVYMYDSFLGYRYLCEHLATWGCVVFSLKCELGSVPTDGFKLLDAAEALRGVGASAAFGTVPPEVWAGPITFVGQSNGGGAAQNAALAPITKPEGVVPVENVVACVTFGPNASTIAPVIDTTPLPGEVSGTPIEFVTVTGTLDYAVEGNQALLGWFRLPRPRTLVFVNRAAHNPFNTLWATEDGRPATERQSPSNDDNGTSEAALEDVEHQAVAIAVVAAVVLGCSARHFRTAGDPAAASYPASMESLLLAVHGSRKLPGIGSIDFVTDYAPLYGPSALGRIVVVDSFGTPVPEAGILADLAHDVSSNTLGQNVVAPPGAYERAAILHPALADGDTAPDIMNISPDAHLLDFVLDPDHTVLEVANLGALDPPFGVPPEDLGIRVGLSRLVDHDERGVWTTTSLALFFVAGDFTLAARGPPSDCLVVLICGGVLRWIRLGSLGVIPFPDVGGKNAATDDGLYDQFLGYYGGFSQVPSTVIVPWLAGRSAAPDSAEGPQLWVELVALEPLPVHLALDEVDFCDWRKG